MIKLKTILSEAYAWEREAGKALPTMKSVQEKYEKNLKEQGEEKEWEPNPNPTPDPIFDGVNEAHDSHNMSALIELYHQYKDGKMSKEIFYQLLKILNPDEREELMGYIKTRRDSENYKLPDESPMDYSDDFMEEAYDAKGIEDAADEANDGEKPDYIDADKDGNEKESMKKAFADKEDNVNEGVMCETCECDPCTCDDDKEVDESALNMGELEESKFWGRVKGNFKGHEYILREAFRK